jgi:ABC-type transport system involved in multi-copper enzyme maturation permease subunit
MGCGLLFLRVLFQLFTLIWVRRGFPRSIYYGLGVGAIVGVIIALIRNDWLILLYSCVVGAAAGVVFQLIIISIDRIDKWQRSRE